MSQEVTIAIRLVLPDGATFRIVTDPAPDDFEHEPLPIETFASAETFEVPTTPINAGPITPMNRTMATAQPAARVWQVGEVHLQGHKPLKAGRNGGLFCPQKLQDGSWCQFRV